MIYQFYVTEIQQYADGSYGDIKHIAYDEDADKALLKAKSKYYEVLSAACVSELPSHAVILFSSEGFPILHECVKKTITPAVEPDEGGEDEPAEG